MSRIADQVRAFHLAFKIGYRESPVGVIDEAGLRQRLLLEEVQEYCGANAIGDVVEIADALADIVYVAYGTALAHGINLDAVLDEVHASNMSKLGADGQPIFRADGKVLKGPGYFRPKIAFVLGVS